MFAYVTGDLLQSEAQCLVNTVNCEGYMGKGIAYQFKLAFPENNASYVKACKNGSLHIGALHYFQEKGKIIVNFPTKDKWRAKSKLEYIDIGLNRLSDLIETLHISSIAVPPLGSGNGGLIWADVRRLIEKKLAPLAASHRLNVYIYEPAKNCPAAPTAEPQLSAQALVLMQMKLHLRRFSRLRLQKAAYLMDVFRKQHYFRFEKYKGGPYDRTIELISRKIREFQQYYNVGSTAEAYEIAYRKLASESVDAKLRALIPFIEKAADYANGISQDAELECITALLFFIEINGPLPEKDLAPGFQSWSEDRAGRFPEAMIWGGIDYLYDTGVIEKSLIGYRII